MGETPPEEDDATLARRIAEDRDQSALAELMKRYAPKATGYLQRQFKHQLQHPEIDQAVIDAAFKVWNKAHSFDQAKKFGPWFLSIVHRAALDILEGEDDQPSGGLDFDPPDHNSDSLDDDPGYALSIAWRVQQMEQIIEHELKGFEQIVARADLAVGGRADTELLMKQHNKKKSVVQSTRSKVRKKIREMILERESLRERTQVNP